MKRLLFFCSRTSHLEDTCMHNPWKRPLGAMAFASKFVSTFAMVCPQTWVIWRFPTGAILAGDLLVSKHWRAAIAGSPTSCSGSALGCCINLCPILTPNKCKMVHDMLWCSESSLNMIIQDAQLSLFDTFCGYIFWIIPYCHEGFATTRRIPTLNYRC